MSTCKRMWTDREIRSMAGDTAKTLIEAGQTENAKPIYLHPITINYGGLSILTMLIFNNDDSAFTRESLVAYLKDSKTKGRYLVNGALFNASYYLSPAYCAIASSGTEEGKLILIGIDSTGYTHSSATDPINFESIISDSGTFVDEVNKIN